MLYMFYGKILGMWVPLCYRKEPFCTPNPEKVTGAGTVTVYQKNKGAGKRGGALTERRVPGLVAGTDGARVGLP